MAILPVNYLDAHGNDVGDTINAYPCVRLSMSFREVFDAAGNQKNLEDVFPIVAVIDTGAQISSIMIDRVPSWAAPEASVGSIGITGAGISHIHRACIWVAEAKWIASGVLFGTMPRMNNVPFDVILGREFLQNTNFDYDGRRGITWLELPVR